MASLQIRKLPQDVYESLAFRARLESRSLAQQAIADLKQLSEAELRDRRHRVIEQLREKLARPNPRSLPFSPEEAIRKDRSR